MSACSRNHLDLSSPGKECGYDSMILNQSDFLSHDQGQMLGPELNLSEMSEGEYTHLHQLIQTHMETQAEESDMPTEQSTNTTKDVVMSPLSTTQAIDLSTSADGHETRVPSTARVCLEKRFNSIPENLGPQHNQSAVLSNFLTVVQPPSETQDSNIHSHPQKWIRCERRTDALSGTLIGIYNPVTNVCAPVLSHLEPNLQQTLVIPKGLPLNLCPERLLTKNNMSTNSPSKGVCTIDLTNKKMSLRAAKSVQLRAKAMASKDSSDSSRKTGSDVKKCAHRVVPLSLRREKHNSKERERRRNIRLCCDELNRLVPFCHSDTDKVTTLQWTAAYLKYINKMYGDTVREEFLKTFTEKNGLQPDPSAVSELILQDTQNIPMAVEP
ncbi:hypothetical protein WMY93_031446 [Mugilogobius chulae]|uniref:BHLH domain-containing protein n=1 Tax=Mugilogobius chulae TaxID=88201 RepID=A0AAW0MG24_9GOBI